MNIVRLAGALLAGVSLAASPLTGQERAPIIDMHLHTHSFPDLPAGMPSLCRPAPCEGSGGATATSTETMQKTLEQMRRYNIVKGFLSGDPQTVQQWKSVAPDRFIASVFIMQPGHPSVEMLRREYVEGRLAGMGEVATQLSGYVPNDPALQPYFALAEELDIPVHIHIAGIGPHLPEFRSAAGSPLLLEPVLKRYPKLRLYTENAGYPYMNEMIAMMYQYPQLYGDLSTITWLIPRSAFYQYLRGLMQAGLGKRLMFGSDQMRWPEKIGEAIAAIEEAAFLTPEQKRDILHDNAARFLRLSSDQMEAANGRAARPGPGARDGTSRSRARRQAPAASRTESATTW